VGSARTKPFIQAVTFKTAARIRVFRYNRQRLGYLGPTSRSMNGIRLGTSAFTAAGWESSFYPAGMNSRDFLSYYATKFDTVEVDSTYYGTPSPSTVSRWASKVPEGFLFSAKVPQAITHQNCLKGCNEDFATFVNTINLLGNKLGPLVLQFPYFGPETFRNGAGFIERLRPFLTKLPKLDGHRFAVEIRNKYWINAQFLDLLRKHNVAFVLQDQSWMPRPTQLFEKLDPITADFTYVRWLGDRKGIEKLTKIWNMTVIDRTVELQEWVKYCHLIRRRGVIIFGYANNHYAGHGPATVELFRKLYSESSNS
jgi:uncharacterized protein YecE (DUF72 family)